MSIEINVIKGPAKGQVFTFDKPDCFLFGRSRDARISLPKDPYLSRLHFLLEISPPACKVTDLGSKNGLFVNNIRYGGRKQPDPGIIQAPGGANGTSLSDGDEIEAGDTLMKISICKAESTLSSPDAISDYPVEESATLTRVHARGRVLCTQCQKDVTGEIGIYGMDSIVDYVCDTCRETLSRNPDSHARNSEIPEPQDMADIPVFFQGYRIQEELGSGGMGKVYKAIDEQTGKIVAIKTMLPHTAINAEKIRSFQREIEVTRQLQHKNIVKMLDHGNEQGIFFFVMEYVDGTDLADYIRTKGGRLDLNDAIPLMTEILEGLSYAHKTDVEIGISGGIKKRFTGLVHRDIKPQNILIGSSNNIIIPKIADFGLSKSFESAGLTDMTVPGQIAGTPIYWPREQITHYKYLNPATDVFSIAAVFYEMLTGSWVRDGFTEMFAQCRRENRKPAISDYIRLIAKNQTVPIRRRCPDIPRKVADVIDRALSEDEVPIDEKEMRTALAKLRYPDAEAFNYALTNALKQETERVHHSVIISSGIHSDMEKTDNNANKEILFTVLPDFPQIEATLFVLDLVKSTHIVCQAGDTIFTSLISDIHAQFKKHESSRSLIFIKCTGDGFFAAYHSVSDAFSIASMFIEKNDRQVLKAHFRMALHHGFVKKGPGGDLLGTEAHRLFRMEGIKDTDRVDASNAGSKLPLFARIIASKQVLDQMNEVQQSRFVYAGKFRLKGFSESSELWVAHGSDKL